MDDAVAAVIRRMEDGLAALAPDDARRYFHGTYQRTTLAVADEIDRGGFEDPDWVERWDVVFADLYLDALEADLPGPAPVPPPVAARVRRAGRTCRPLRHVLLGINAHINYDLPQALLAVISDAEFADPPCWPRGGATTSASTACSPAGSRPRTTSSAARAARSARSTGCSARSTGAPPTVPARGAAEGLAQHAGAPRAPGSRARRRTPPAG